MSTIKNIVQYITIYEEAQAIIDSGASWETKFDLIFSEQISQKLNQLFPIEYCDPDTSYEEDVKSYVNAVKHKCMEFRSILRSHDEYRSMFRESEE